MGKELEQLGFYENGEERVELPKTFFKGIEWEPIEDLKDKTLFRMHYMRPRDIAETIMEHFGRYCKIPHKTVGQWFSRENARFFPRNAIKRPEKGKRNEVWVRKEIVNQIIDKLGLPPFIWERPAKTAPTIEVKPVPENSIILQRIGGMQGNIKQLYKADRELDGKIDARHDESMFYIKTLYDRLGETIPEYNQTGETND